MAVFAFEAIDTAGRKTNREIDATDKNEALQKIKGMGLRPTKLRQKKGAAKAAVPSAGDATEKKGGLRFLDRVTIQQLTTFTSQLATLQDAGLPIVRSLRILAQQMKPCRFKDQINSVCDEVESGSSFSDALQKFPKTFRAFCSNASLSHPRTDRGQRPT